jgi:hypothetical protein
MLRGEEQQHFDEGLDKADATAIPVDNQGNANRLTPYFFLA